MKNTTPEIAPALLLNTGARSATAIGLVQGEPQSPGAFLTLQEHSPTPLLANTGGAAMIMVIMTGLILLTSRLNRRRGAVLILACIGFYGLAALYAIQAVASMRP